MKGDIIKIAATLLDARLSEFQEDYKFKIPKYMVRKIEKHNDVLLSCVNKLKDISARIEERRK